MNEQVADKGTEHSPVHTAASRPINANKAECLVSLEGGGGPSLEAPVETELYAQDKDAANELIRVGERLC